MLLLPFSVFRMFYYNLYEKKITNNKKEKKQAKQLFVIMSPLQCFIARLLFIFLVSCQIDTYMFIRVFLLTFVLLSAIRSTLYMLRILCKIILIYDQLTCDRHRCCCANNRIYRKEYAGFI